MQAEICLEVGTLGWGGTLGFKYLMYYSNTDLDPQGAFASYQKCSNKVLSECGKFHFRDQISKHFSGRGGGITPRLTCLMAYIFGIPPGEGGILRARP